MNVLMYLSAVNVIAYCAVRKWSLDASLMSVQVCMRNLAFDWQVIVGDDEVESLL